MSCATSRKSRGRNRRTKWEKIIGNKERTERRKTELRDATRRKERSERG